MTAVTGTGGLWVMYLYQYITRHYSSVQQVSRFGELELSGVGRGGGSAEKPPLCLSVDETALRLNGDPVTLATLGVARADHGGQRLLVSLSRDVLAQRLVDVLATLRSVSGLSVTVLE